MLRPSLQPSSVRRWRNAPSQACACGLDSVIALRTPTRRMRSGSSARARSGDAAAAPANSAMKSRRRIVFHISEAPWLRQISFGHPAGSQDKAHAHFRAIGKAKRPRPPSLRHHVNHTTGYWRGRSAPLAQAAAFECDDLAARAVVENLFRHLLGDPEQPLAPLHLLPDILRTDAGGDPQHDEMVDEIGAFLDDRFAVAEHGIEDYLDRLLGELLRHLAAAGAQKPGGPRGRRIVVAAGECRVIEAGDRIRHAADHNTAISSQLC